MNRTRMTPNPSKLSCYPDHIEVFHHIQAAQLRVVRCSAGLGIAPVDVERVITVEAVDVEVTVRVPGREVVAAHGWKLRAVPSTLDEHVGMIGATAWRIMTTSTQRNFRVQRLWQRRKQSKKLLEAVVNGGSCSGVVARADGEDYLEDGSGRMVWQRKRGHITDREKVREERLQ
jgi:hypothetical protein